jgi:maleylacetoacetate isomerase
MTVLYSYFRSSASYRVRIALALKELSYDSVPVHLVRGGGEQHSAAFAALNPAELVPVLVDGDVTLTQSLAIIEYIDEMHPLPALLPADPQGRARVRSLAQTIACDIHPLNNLRVLQQLEAMFGASSEARNAWYTLWVVNGFDVIEDALAQAPADFCHGDTPTLADCCLVPQVYNAMRFSVSMEKFPHIRRVNDACLALKAFQRASPEAQPDAS